MKPTGADPVPAGAEGRCSGFRPLPGAITAFPGKLQAGFVVKLVGPAVGMRNVDHVVPGILDFLAQGGGTDDAHG